MTHLAALAAMLLLAIPGSADGGSVTLEAIALEGAAAPSGPAGTTFAGAKTPGFAVLNSPLTNDAAQLVFQGGLVQGVGGVTAADDAVVWAPGTDGQTAPVLREGTPAPSAPFGAVFSRFHLLSFGAGGHLAVRAETTATDISDFGLWGPDSRGDFSLLAMENKDAPGAPEGARFLSLGEPVLNGLGQIAFGASLVIGPGGIDDDSDQGLWGPDATGTLTLLLHEGDPTPGNDPPGTTIAGAFGPKAGDLNDDGSIVSVGRVAGGGLGTLEDGVLWARGGTGSFGVVAREGTEAPGTGGGVFFPVRRGSDLNAGGTFLIAAGLVDGIAGVTDANDSGLWTATTTGSVTLLHREDGPAPGPAGARFSDLALTVADLNDAGNIAFFHNLKEGFGGVTAADNQVILGPNTSGALTILAREGDLITGGLQLKGLFNVDLSQRGDTAFEATVEVGPGGADGGSNELLMVAQPDGDLTIVVREGDALEVAPGDTRTIANIAQCCRWNAQGRLAFSLSFDDGTSGVFVATLDDAPPAPAVAGPVPPPPGSEAPFTKAQRRCADTTVRGYRNVAKAAGRDACDCIRDHNKGDLDASDLPSCARSDPKGRVAKAAAKAAAKHTKDCSGFDSGGAPKQPALFAEAAAAVADDARTQAAELLAVVYGPDVAAAAIDEATDRDGAGCQRAVAKALKKCQDATAKAFRKCKKKALEPDKDPIPFGARRAVDLEACMLAEPTKCLVREGSGPGDVFAADKIRKALDRKCIARDVDLASAFPHCGSADLGTVHGCLEQSLACVACANLNAAEGLDVDCDFLDDGIGNESCLTCNGRLATIVAGTGITQGTEDDDVIVVAAAAAGIVQGNGGNDAICGGPNRDFLFGGEGHDWLNGGNGDDGLVGEGGDDTLLGGPGDDDSCNGGPGTDVADGCETEIEIP